jgi:hypothetical protein
MRKEIKMEKVYALRMTIDLWRQLEAKAGFIPVAVVIRRLIEKFVRGEVDID